MANLNAVLNDRILRLARKAIRSETASTRRKTANYRRDIAALKRLVTALQKRLGGVEKTARKIGGPSAAAGETHDKSRFRVDGLRSHRKRLGLSAANYGKLIGVSGLTVYAWESGKFRPRRQQLAKLVTIRGIGKREADKRLAS